MERLDVLLAAEEAALPQPASQPLETLPEKSSVFVSMTANADGTVHFDLSLSGLEKGHIQSTASTPRARAHSKRGGLADGAALEIMLILKDAVDTNRPPILELVLDCLQKLISFNLLQGSVSILTPKKGEDSRENEESVARAPEFAAQPPQAQALELCMKCDDSGDEAVELRLLKTLLTAVTSPRLHVHGQALLLIVRSFYQIFLTSRSEVNQTTSKAALTQTMGVVFQRMEAGSEQIVPPAIVVSDALGLPPTDTSNMSAFVQQFLHEVITTVDPWGQVSEGITQSLDDAFDHRAQGDVVSEAAMVADASDPTDRQHIDWRENPNKTEERVSPPASSAASSTVLHEMSSSTQEKWGSGVSATLQKDAFLVFRALCKLSIRSMDSVPGSELTTIRGKALALQLLKLLLDNSGPIFQSSQKFMSAIRQYLCLSLLKNASSSVPQVQRLCASIFLTLLLGFRKALKAEIGVFYAAILLRAIEAPVTGATPNATSMTGTAAPVDAGAKAVVLRCLQVICEDGQLLVDIFVNYDCDLEGANLFERSVIALVRISQGRGSSASELLGMTPEEEQIMRYEALSCLVSCLRSMTDWNVVMTTDRQVSVNKIDIAAAAASPQKHAGEDSTASSTFMVKAPAGLGLEDEQKSNWMKSLAAGDTADAAKPPNLGDEIDRRQGELLESWKAFKRAFEEGVYLFNQKPKKGIEFLQQHKLIGASAKDVANFLAQTRGLDKALVGDYLGEREEFNLKVMHSYVDSIEFTDLEFDNAIRKFLEGFRLPGEAQKIDRLMEKFAERFLSCNPETFKSADVAYVLAYSVIMLNTDAHNPGVKNKMTKPDFLRNNRGINDGGDLPGDFMESLYDRIVLNEIKMKDDESGTMGGRGAKQVAAAGWLDTIANLIPGRQHIASNEPDDEAVRNTHERLREKAKGATFFEAKDAEAVRPMLNVAWAPVLGALSTIFEEMDDPAFAVLCLQGFVAAIRLTSALNMGILRSTFVSSLARFTMLHSPGGMRRKNAEAFRALLTVADSVGNQLGDGWQDVLRCVSRWELLTQVSAGLPSDAFLFAMPAPPDSSSSQAATLGKQQHRTPSKAAIARDSVSSVHDMGLHAGAIKATGGLPPLDVLQSIDALELNRLFVDSSRLDADAVVEFVSTLCMISREELRSVSTPRVFSLTKIVELAHFNMSRIRLVWSKIWAVLSDFFIEVGCHENLGIAMYAVDSLRQLAMKFLERDELANYTFQNDFLRPFVVVVRRAKAPEIRELIIRCCSQMILSRVENIKSGWKSMFMVFTAAAGDESPAIVRLAFDTIERIVREHFDHITETEATTFTDAVNCLVAFTNNPHSLDVSLNAIAFIRFCALQLAEGGIREVTELPEGAAESAYNPNAHRIRPRGYKEEMAEQKACAPLEEQNGAIRFTDKDEHMYFWFPLLAGLSELTFDPRPEIRRGSLEVLFDILKFHGSSFSATFWVRIFDSVLLPIFDHVRAEVTDTTTFTDDRRRDAADAWLYETCTSTLAHIVDLVALYQQQVPLLLKKVLHLLGGFVRRQHKSLAGVGVAALARLAYAAGPTFNKEQWLQYVAAIASATRDTCPNVAELVRLRMEKRTEGGVSWSLGKGAGARRMGEMHIKASVHLLLVQACAEIFAGQVETIHDEAARALLDAMKHIAAHAAVVDADIGLRHSLQMAQAADKVASEKSLADPPLLTLEVEAAQSYLGALLKVLKCGSASMKSSCDAENRVVALCISCLERFERQSIAISLNEESFASHREEGAALAPVAVAALRALEGLSDGAFKGALKELFPLLTSLISCESVPPEAQRLLSELFANRVGPLLR